MAKTNNLTDFLTDLADGIRSKKGTSIAINPQDFRSEIESIETGTDTSDATATEDKVFLNETFYAGGAKKTGTFTIASEISSQDGLISAIKTALQGKASGGGTTPAEPIIEPLEVTENGTYTAPIGVDGYSPVAVNIPIPEGYIQPSGTLNVTENGTHNVAEYAEVNVNVEASGDDEGTNAQWFADLITDSERTVEVYNDKFEGTLSAYAFYERSNVTKIELPNLQYLKERCFFGCQNLKTLLLPNLLGYTYQYMASGCTKLVDVDIHGTSYVSSYTFQSCTSLKKVDLHRVGTIGTNAFNGATKFETLIIRTDTVPSLGGTNAFTNTKIKSGGTGYIYVKSALLEDFKAATNWSSFETQFRAIEDYPEITGG
jgi:hypothetical protein